MLYRCLADFLEELSHTGQLRRVEDEVDSACETARIVGQTAREGGPALLFAAVRGHDLPVLCNLLATEGRICRAIGVASLDEIADRIGRLLDVSAPEGWFERLKGGRSRRRLAACCRARSSRRLVSKSSASAATSTSTNCHYSRVAKVFRRQSPRPRFFRPSPTRICRLVDVLTCSGSTRRSWPCAGPRTTITPGCWANIGHEISRCRWP